MPIPRTMQISLSLLTIHYNIRIIYIHLTCNDMVDFFLVSDLGGGKLNRTIIVDLAIVRIRDFFFFFFFQVFKFFKFSSLTLILP